MQQGRDLLALFFNYKDENGNGFGAAARTKEMTDIVLNFIIAGRDTTACTLYVVNLLRMNKFLLRIESL